MYSIFLSKAKENLFVPSSFSSGFYSNRCPKTIQKCLIVFQMFLLVIGIFLLRKSSFIATNLPASWLIWASYSGENPFRLLAVNCFGYIFFYFTNLTHRYRRTNFIYLSICSLIPYIPKLRNLVF